MSRRISRQHPELQRLGDVLGADIVSASEIGNCPRDLADLVVQRLMRIPGHCGFSVQEQIRAFDDLVAWVQQGTKPPGDSVFGDLSNAGLTFTTPLRPNDPGGIRITR